MSNQNNVPLMLLVAALSGGVGVAVGLWLGDDEADAPEHETAETPPVDCRAECAALAARRGPTAPAPTAPNWAAPAPTPAPTTGPTWANVRAMLIDAGAGGPPVQSLGDLVNERGTGTDPETIIQAAIADRVIDAREREQLGTLLPNLTRAQQNVIIERLVSASVDGGVSFAP